MKKKRKAKKYIGKTITQDDSYLNELKEWQEHQYDPGYYTGGRIPPMFTNSGKPDWLGWTFVFISVTCSILMVLIVNGFEKKQLFEMIPVFGIIFGAALLQFIAGVRLINKGRRKKFNLKLFVVVLCSVILLTVLTLFIYNANNNNDEIIIKKRNEFALKQSSGSNFVYIKAVDKVLKCSFDDYFVLWSMEIGDETHIKNTSYKITYSWSNFSPSKGKILNITKITDSQTIPSKISRTETEPVYQFNK